MLSRLSTVAGAVTALAPALRKLPSSMSKRGPDGPRPLVDFTLFRFELVIPDKAADPGAGR
jgi:hypothetical protein